MRKNWNVLIIILIFHLFVGAIASISTAHSLDTWYHSLNKSPFNPPDWIFAPVWTLLYLLMGVSFWLVWTKVKFSPIAYPAYTAYALQLFFNALWSPLFFVFQSPKWAFVDLIFLWFMIGMTTVLFRKISKEAAWLLQPYWLWVAFAGYLNYEIWRLNP